MKTAERKWTAAQRRAIDFRGKNLILSAAAGSGKTATLTQRIIELIKDTESGARLDRMLVVTFTQAAAGELKQRIGDALNSAIAENPRSKHLIRQLAALEGAKISTIHSFFKSELTPYATELGLPPDFAVLDETECSIMRAEAMRDTCDGFFELNNDTARRFERFCDCISDARDESSVDEMLLRLRDSLASDGTDAEKIVRAAELLENNADNIASTSYYAPVVKKMREGAAHFDAMFKYVMPQLASMENTSKYVSDVENCAALAREIGRVSSQSYGEMYAFISGAAMKKLSPFKRGEIQPDEYIYFKDLRADFSEFLKELKGKYFNLDSGAMADVCRRTAAEIRTLADVIGRFEELYGKMKRERGGVDYNDLECFAKKLFCTDDGMPTDKARAVGSKYDCVFIDEYQDTNAVQDTVFSAIASECGRFMVGDVKQSIYAFRGAKPQIFTSYRERYEKGDGGEAVFMSENFRSDSGVIGFTNLVSAYIFSTGATPFEKGDRLVFAKGEDGGVPCEICAVDKDGEGLTEGKNPEAEYVADRIKAMLSGETLSGGKKTEPGDIAILMRTGSAADDYVNALSARGIPASNGAAEEFFAYGEVLLVLCFLNAVDNPLRDTYLAGAMKSPLCGFDLTDLVKIRGCDRDPLWYSVRRYAEGGEDGELRCRCGEFTEKINAWRIAAREMTADEILRLIIKDTGLLLYEGDSERSKGDIARSVKVLISHACKVARRGGGLHDLVAYLRGLTEQKDKSVNAGTKNSVTVLNVHKSKGLEYPVCFICECHHEFNKSDAQKRIISGSGGEIAMKLYDEGGLVRCDTPLRAALGAGLTARSIEEEARILYVAMTRARERLIITLRMSDAEKTLEDAALRAREPLSAYTVNHGGSWGRWILDAAMRSPADGSFRIIKNAEFKSGADMGATGEKNDTEDKKLEEFLSVPIDIDDGKEYLRNIPAKLTVSKLRPDILNSSDSESTTFDSPAAIISMPEAMMLPRFMDKKHYSAAEAGTATHIFMQFCNWQRLYDKGAENELQCLMDFGFISRENAELVRLNEIELFRKSSLMERMLGARSVMREKRFNAVLPAYRFTTDSALAENLKKDDISITVQGVVDCIFTDAENKNVLVDYKTDRLTKEELADASLAEKKLISRHERQLALYRDICEGIIGKSFDEVCIYSLPLGDVIKIPKSAND